MLTEVHIQGITQSSAIRAARGIVLHMTFCAAMRFFNLQEEQQQLELQQHLQQNEDATAANTLTFLNHLPRGLVSR